MKCRPRPELPSFAKLEQMRDRSGLALPAVLLAMLLIAALTAGVFSAMTEETRIGIAAADRLAALMSAESAIEITLEALSRTSDGTMAVGEIRARSIDGLGLPVVVHVTRLDSSLYWLLADAGDASPSSGTARRIGILARAKSDSAHSITIDRISSRSWSELF